MSMTATVSSPPSPAVRAAKPRTRAGIAKDKLFGSLMPLNNPLAVRAYGLSLYGLVPLVGAVCGPVAFGLGLVGGVLRGRKPEIGGGNFVLAAVILGGIESLAHVFGLASIARGLGWL